MKAWALRLQASLEELSPEQVALVLSVGLVLGVFPIMGVPTILCLLAAFGFRLNVAALQVVNNISSPLQIALLVPLARAGGRLCGVSAASGSAWAGRIGAAAVNAVTGWACICVPSGVLLYLVLLILMRRPWQTRELR